MDPSDHSSEFEQSIPEEIKARVPYQEVRRVVQSLSLHEYDHFDFNGQTHQLIFCDVESGSPIEFHQSTVLSGCDIYIWKSVVEKGEAFLLTALVHELSEIAIYDILLVANIGERQVTSYQSHNLALLYEERFKRENFDSEQQRVLEETANELRKKMQFRFKQ